MNKTILSLLALLLAYSAATAQTERSFPNFTWAHAHFDKDGSRFGYEKSSFTPVFKNCQKLPKSDPCHEDEDYPEKTLIGRYKNGAMKEYANILYTPGPSGDPEFLITDKKNKTIWSQVAEELCITSTGTIYTSGNKNRMFNHRLKFQFINGKVQEVKQPYYLVNVKGKLLKPVKLYSQKNDKGELVATLPIGYEIEILLSETDPGKGENQGGSDQKNYLARTAFGLVGWLHLKDADMMALDSPIVKGLGYMGD